MTRYHFIGIGGIGMSGLAQLLLAQGASVAGSDLSASDQTQAVIQAGGRVWLGHRAEQVDGAGCVVYSSAIRPENPELAEARRRGIPIVKRAELLAQLMRGHVGVAVAGAHGKTTTTSMISTILRGAGLQPTSVVGGVVINYGSNAELGRGRLFVVETDESDGSFLHFEPTYAVITNVDDEHLDFFKLRERLDDAFVAFVHRVKPKGQVWLCADQPELRRLAARIRRPVRWYGCGSGADVRADEIVLSAGESRFTVWADGRLLGRVHLQVPGRHNVVNALAAVGIGLRLGVPFDRLAAELSQFRGARRRMEVKLREPLMVVDDYAHHPTEIAATLAAARLWPHERMFVIFQPHRFTRTKLLKERFAEVLREAPHVVLTDLYAASEPPIEGISSHTILELLRQAGHPSARYVPKEEVVDWVGDAVRPGDLVLCLGAGDITKIADRLAKELATRWTPTRNAT